MDRTCGLVSFCLLTDHVPLHDPRRAVVDRGGGNCARDGGQRVPTCASGSRSFGGRFAGSISIRPKAEQELLTMFHYRLCTLLILLAVAAISLVAMWYLDQSPTAMLAWAAFIGIF